MNRREIILIVSIVWAISTTAITVIILIDKSDLQWLGSVITIIATSVIDIVAILYIVKQMGRDNAADFGIKLYDIAASIYNADDTNCEAGVDKIKLIGNFYDILGAIYFLNDERQFNKRFWMLANLALLDFIKSDSVEFRKAWDLWKAENEQIVKKKEYNKQKKKLIDLMNDARNMNNEFIKYVDMVFELLSARK